MIRQIVRLMLLILAGIGSMVRKYPGPSTGFIIGAVIGFVIGKFLIRYGAPGWLLPLQVLAIAVLMAGVVKDFFDRLAGPRKGA
jgi:hypothetical protein